MPIYFLSYLITFAWISYGPTLEINSSYVIKGTSTNEFWETSGYGVGYSVSLVLLLKSICIEVDVLGVLCKV